MWARAGQGGVGRGVCVCVEGGGREGQMQLLFWCKESCLSMTCLCLANNFLVAILGFLGDVQLTDTSRT